MSKSITSHEIDYAMPERIQHSNPRYVKVSPQSTSSVSLSATSITSFTEFLITSTSVCNLSRSYLQGDVTFVSPASGTASVSDYPWCAANPLAFINRIVVTTQQGVVLVDESNASKFSLAQTFISTDTQDYLTNVKGVQSLQSSQIAAQRNPICEINRSDSTITPITSGTASTLNTNALCNFYSDYAGANSGAVAPRLLLPGPPATNAAQTTYVSFQFSLSAFKHTLLAIDKTLAFNDNVLSVQIYWQPYSSFAWNTSTNTASVNYQYPGGNYPATGSGATGGAMTIRPMTSTTISNLQLVVMQEMNFELQKAIQEKARSEEGITIAIPFVYSQRQVASGASQSVQFNLSNGYGSTLRQVYWAPQQLPAAGSGDFYMGAFNLGINQYQLSGGVLGNPNYGAALTTASQVVRGGYANAQLTNYTTYMDNLAIISQSGINTSTAAEHWWANLPSINNGSCLSVEDYSNVFCNIDNFCAAPLSMADETLVDGLDLNESHVWSIVCNWSAATAQTAANGLNTALVDSNIQVAHFIFIVTQRLLRINKNGVSVI